MRPPVPHAVYTPANAMSTLQDSYVGWLMKSAGL